MQPDSPLMIVEAWQAAANQRDVEQVLALSDPNIAIVGPRGVGYGHILLREWLERAGLQLTTQRIFVRNKTVVVAQHGVWHSLETNTVLGEADVASLFRVQEGRIISIARYDSVNEALEAGGIEDSVRGESPA